MKLVIEFSREDLNRLRYPVIVEGWKKVVSCGSVRRRYEAEFSAEERDRLGAFAKKLFDWHLHNGTPEFFIFREGADIELLQRAAAFFAAA